MQRNKRDIHTEKLDGLCQIFQRDIADVRAFHIHNTFIGAQTPCKLTIADIHGIDLGGTILQHTVRKAACRCTDIHADFTIRRQRKTLHGFFQLQTAAAHITDIMSAHFYLGILFDHFAGLVHLLFIDKYDAGHNQCLCTLPALCQAMLNKILIQPNLHDKLSPFVTAI